MRFSAGERWTLLTKREITQPDVLEQREGVVSPRVRGEETGGFVHAHREHLADVLVLETHRERLRVEARAAAGVAGHFHVGQKAHLDPPHALAFAHFTASAGSIEGKAARGIAAHACFRYLGVEAPDCVPEADVSRRAGARGLSDRRLVHLQHAPQRIPALDRAAAMQPAGTAFFPPIGDETCEVRVKHVARERRLAAAGNTGHHGQPAERHARVHASEVVQARTDDPQRGAAAVDRAAWMQGVLERLREKAPGHRSRDALQVVRRAFSDDKTAAAAGAGPEVHHVRGAAYRLLVVLDHDQGVAFRLELGQRIEQDAVVAWMQPDGGLIEDVGNATQVGTELRGEPDALRFAPGERRRGAVEREIRQPNLAQKGETARDFGHDIARDFRLAALKREAADERLHLRDREGGDVGNRAAAEAHRERNGIQPLAPARRAGLGCILVPFVPPNLFAGLLVVKAGESQTRAAATLAPAVTGVVGEETGIELRKARPAGGAGALHREHRFLHRGERGVALRHRALQPLQRRNQVHDALAVPDGTRERRAQLVLVVGCRAHVRHRQLDGVLAEAVEARPGGGGDEHTVHPQVRVALAARPFGEIGVVALAVHDKRREQPDAIAAVVAQDARGDRIQALRLDRHRALRAVLGAELHVEQAQEVVDLGQRRHRALPAAAARALLDRHRRRYAGDRIHVGARCGLDELAGVGIERFQVAALALREHDIEGESGFAAAGDAGHHREAVPRNRDVHVLQIVLARVVDLYRIVTVAEGRFRRLHCGARGHKRGLVFPQRFSGVRAGMRGDLRGRADRDDFAARVSALGTKVYDPVGGADHIEVVLDHQQGMACGEQLAKRAQQPGDVVEMQSGRRFVE